MKGIRMSRRLVFWVVAAVIAVAAGITVPVTTLGGSSGGGHVRMPRVAVAAPAAPASPGPFICGQPVLDSPWSYNGGATTFTSGQYPGLPTYGSPGTNFPDATSGVIIPAGDNTSAAHAGTYTVNHRVYYFEPGVHDIINLMYAGNYSYYVGGYTAGAGKAVIDGVDGATNGTGLGGSQFEHSVANTNNDTYNTWEYLTVENYTSGRGSAVMGAIDGPAPVNLGFAGFDVGDTYKYDTIGPNNYGYVSNTAPPAQGQSSDGGYGIEGNSNTAVNYDCFTSDAEGGVNISSAVNVYIDNSEFTGNGLGEYPDNGSSPGSSPFNCGCSAGLGKFFWTINSSVVNNYVHDNYNVGIWYDTNDSGSLISHNYVADNWGDAIDYESSYNANISDNTFTGNGYSPTDSWPAGTGGGNCFANIPCQWGFGPEAIGSYGLGGRTIFLSTSGGDSALSTVSIPSFITVPGCSSNCSVVSRFAGMLNVTGNRFINEFGGVTAYTDTSRFPGSLNNQGCDTSLGGLYQTNSSTYYVNTGILTTAADTSISGTSVSSTGGTKTMCDNYGISPPTSGQYFTYQSVVTAPVAGMHVIDQTTGILVGTVNTVTNANSFTLSGTPPGGSYTNGDPLTLDTTGGCGPADYYGATGPGQTSGTPSADYWDHCAWISHNIAVSGNYFYTDSSVVSHCTAVYQCGFQTQTSFRPGVPAIEQNWFGMTTYMRSASGGLNIIWSDNNYHWVGPGAWSFHAGDQNIADDISQATWLGEGQDAGSKF